MDRLEEGAVVKTPEKPSSPDAPNRDWTEVKEKEAVEEPPEPPKEPIYKQLPGIPPVVVAGERQCHRVGAEINRRPCRSVWRSKPRMSP
jgi:hypothetical protein